ncbi:hypothetical protein MPH_11875 [Macrophomina phaseolina MS6]|uniref:Uncharacterized protein n=1 Tax=Macrophomina phaseolina (strain MS6) TaxID=1126212 RepID=K2R8X8_MACPH|nr:hypothetical protein MPH_11875 [Macrophomina phaseolina MS6]
MAAEALKASVKSMGLSGGRAELNEADSEHLQLGEDVEADEGQVLEVAEEVAGGPDYVEIDQVLAWEAGPERLHALLGGQDLWVHRREAEQRELRDRQMRQLGEVGHVGEKNGQIGCVGHEATNGKSLERDLYGQHAQLLWRSEAVDFELF